MSINLTISMLCSLIPGLNCFLLASQVVLVVKNLPANAAAAAANSIQSCPLCATPETAAHQAPPSLGLSRKEHWRGLHFLLQCMKVKSESEVAQLCPTPSDPMDCSLPGSSIHGIFQARVLEWGAIAFSYCQCRRCKRCGFDL